MFRTAFQKAIKNGRHGLMSTSLHTARRLPNVTAISSPSSLFLQSVKLNTIKSNSPFTAIVRDHSTQAEQTKPTFEFDAIAFDEKTERQINIQELQYTDLEKEWKLPEEEAQTPNIIKPLLYCIGIGGLSFVLAAFLTVKETRKAVKDAQKQAEHLPSLHKKFSISSTSKDDIVWGSITEADLRIIQIAKEVERKRGKNITEKEKKDYIVDRDLKDLRPVLYLSIAAFVALRLGGSGVLGKTVFKYVKRNMLQIPAANRLHTLTTSAFSHATVGKFVFNSLSIVATGNLFVISSHLREDSNGKPLHTVEKSSRFHLLAFCIMAGIFSSFFSQVFTRLMLVRAKSLFGRQAAKKMIGRIPEIGSAGIVYSLGAMLIPETITISEHKEDQKDKEVFEALNTLLSGFVALNTGLLSASLYFGYLIRRGDVAAKFAGSIFGFVYYRHGNKLWEQTKNIFYTKEEKLMFAQRVNVEISN